MSITKLKTVGSWHMRRWRDSAAEVQRGFRGRVITGMLTGGDPGSEELAVTQDPRAKPAR